MQINSTVDLINKKLKLYYGVNQYDDPNFRVVFSDDETECRRAVFTDHYNKIFLREVEEVREVRKYPVIKHKWILERWASGELSYHPSLVTIKNGVYICVYIFQDKDSAYLPPIWKVCEIIVPRLLNPIKKSEMMARDEKEDNEAEEAMYNKDVENMQINKENDLIKDPNSIRESLSVGYGENKRRIR